MIGDEPGNTEVDRTLPSELYRGAKDISVCLIVKPVGEPDAGNPHVRFDERGREPGPRSCEYPRPSSTLLKRCSSPGGGGRL